MSNYHIKNLEEYFQVYRKSIREPENFWQEIAEEHFVWRKKWDNVLSWDFAKPEVKWFENAKLNITENCIDRHLLTHGEKTAIIWEPNEPKDEGLDLSFNELHKKVNRFANVLKDNGIGKGDKVCIYLPMIPELAYAVLACARIGAVHSVVFAGFSSSALAARTVDADCKMVITSDGSYRGDKTIDLKGIVDKAMEDCPDVETQKILYLYCILQDLRANLKECFILLPVIWCIPHILSKIFSIIRMMMSTGVRLILAGSPGILI